MLPEVQALRDRVLANAGMYNGGAINAGGAGAYAGSPTTGSPQGRRSANRPPATYRDLNTQTLDPSAPADPTPPPAAAPTPKATARPAVRQPPSATPLAERSPGEDAARPPEPPHAAGRPAAPAAPAAPQVVVTPAAGGTPPAVVGAAAAAAAPVGSPPAGPHQGAPPQAGVSQAGASQAGLPQVAVGSGPGGEAVADGRQRNAGLAPVEVTVSGKDDDEAGNRDPGGRDPGTRDLGGRLAKRVREAPQDLAAQLDYQMFQLLRGEGVLPPPPAGPGLAAEDRNLLATIAEGLSAFRTGLAADASPLLSDKARPLLDMGERIRGQVAMSIPVVELCKKVGGFGVYEPLDRRFSAGVDHPIIVYCEVQNFTSRPTMGRYWETKLSLEVTLSMADGTRIWNDKNEVPTDVSRNRRHDFFVIKHMQLPKKLGVGKYLLKVAVTDEHTKRVAEFNTDVTMVAQ